MSASESSEPRRFVFNPISHPSRLFLPWWPGDIEAELRPTSSQQQHTNTLCQVCENITLTALESRQGYSYDANTLERSTLACNACALCSLIRSALSRVFTDHLDFSEDEEAKKALSNLLVKRDQKVTLFSSAKTDVLVELDPPFDKSSVPGILTLYTTPGTPSAGLTDSFTQCTTSNEALCLAAYWISHCFTTHPECPKITEAPLPKRLVDVGSSDVAPSLRLWRNPCYSTAKGENDEKPTGTYLALSYCWGASHFTVLTPENRETMERKIDLNLLPKTIQDAIQITRKLHIRFLWVDSLCILQGSSAEAQEDWKEQSLQMAAIYRHAALTIGSSTSESAHDGIQHCIKYDDCYFVQLPTTWSSLASHNPMHIGPDACFASSPFKGKLHTRAWTHQERLLSTRYITFGRYGMLWECAHSRMTDNIEDLGFDVFYSDLAPRLPRNPTYIDWHYVVSEYSAMELTKSKDKLIALAGLREYFLQLCSSKDADVAGLWVDNLSWDLLWERREVVGIDVKSCITPSWSWTSIPSPVRWYWAHLYDEKHNCCSRCLCITEASAESFSNESEQGIRGRVRLRAFMKAVKAVAVKNHSLRVVDDSNHFYWAVFDDPTVERSLRISYITYITAAGFFCLQFHEKPGSMGLIVKPTGDWHNEFQRVGIYWSGETEMDLLSQFPVTITLI